MFLWTTNNYATRAADGKHRAWADIDAEDAGSHGAETAVPALDADKPNSAAGNLQN